MVMVSPYADGNIIIQVALLASATAGVALLASHRMATQCLCIIEVIKLNSEVHGIENKDSHAKMGVNSQCVQPLCLPAMYAFVCVLSMVYAFMVLLLQRLCGGLEGFTGISL